MQTCCKQTSKVDMRGLNRESGVVKLSCLESSDLCTQVAHRQVSIDKMQVKKTSHEHAIHEMAESLRVNR